MATITVRVREEVKRKMKELKHINWSEVVRQAIAEEIKRNKMKKANALSFLFFFLV